MNDNERIEFEKLEEIEKQTRLSKGDCADVKNYTINYWHFTNFQLELLNLYKGKRVAAESLEANKFDLSHCSFGFEFEYFEFLVDCDIRLIDLYDKRIAVVKVAMSEIRKLSIF